MSLLLMCGGPHLTQILRYDRAAIAAGQWWRLFSGNLVHLSGWHLLFNLLSLVLLVLLCPERLSAAEWTRRVLLVGTGMSLCLYWLMPRLQTYVGLSGLVYGLFALGLGRQALRRDEIGVVCASLGNRADRRRSGGGIPSVRDRLRPGVRAVVAWMEAAAAGRAAAGEGWLRSAVLLPAD
jgi:rhomboid family GlyGly-CTERM serine protease